jgi:hypothetical protein
MKLLTASAILFLAVSPTFASSYTVSILQVNPPCSPASLARGVSFIPLEVNGDPLIQESFRLHEREFEFGITPAVFGTLTFSATMTLAGRAYAPDGGTIPCIISNGPGCGVGFGWSIPYFRKPVDGTITVSVAGEAE